jgi:hypothetical protein
LIPTDPTGGGFAVRENSNGTMNINGVEVAVFIDKENKYGGNGLNQDRYGDGVRRWWLWCGCKRKPS